MDENGSQSYEGNYDYYIEKRKMKLPEIEEGFKKLGL